MRFIHQCSPPLQCLAHLFFFHAKYYNFCISGHCTSSYDSRMLRKFNSIWGYFWIFLGISWNSDRPNVRFGRTVRPNFYCAVRPKWQNFFLQNTELFFVLHSMSMASFHTFVLLNDQHFIIVIGKIAKRMSTEPKLE